MRPIIRPYLLALLPCTAAFADTLLIANRGGDNAMIFRGVLEAEKAGPKPAATFDTGSGPHEAAASPDGSLGIVCVYGTQIPNNKLLLVDLASGAVRKTIDLGEYKRPHGAAWFKDNRHVLVTAEMAQKIIKVDTQSGTVVRAWSTGQKGSHMLALAPDEQRAYTANVGDHSVSVIDLNGDGAEPATIIKTAPGCEGIAITPDGKQVWTADRSAGNVSVIDTQKLEVVASLAAPGVPIRVAITPDNRYAFVPRPNAGKVSVFSVGDRTLVKEIDTRPPAGADAKPLPSEGPMANQDAPMGITCSPSGKVVYICNLLSGTIAHVDTATLEVVAHTRAGEGPDGIAAAK